MFEFTMGGWWFRWDKLDRPSRRLAGLSMLFALLGGLPLGFGAWELGYAHGRCAGAGDWQPCAELGLTVPPLLAVIAAVCAVLSAIFWARLSARQDEMFNRVQNWSLGMGGAWTGAAVLFWSILALGGVVPWVPVWTAGLLFVGLSTVFWFVAVRRWAY